MKRSLALAGALLLLGAPLAIAHRVDEYLEAATILVSRDRIRVDLRLAPGIAVASTVLDSIDTDHDGAMSGAEQQTYAARVRDEVSLQVDGERVALRVTSRRFPSVADLRDGMGEVQLGFEGDLSPGNPSRQLIFENRHRPQIAAYLANSLVPADPAIAILTQKRNYLQSVYELSWEQLPATATVSLGDALGALLMLIGVTAAVAQGMRALGMRN